MELPPADLAHAGRAKAALRKRLLARGDLEEGPSRVGKGDAFFLRGQEILHFHAGAEVDLRLGRQSIRARKEALGADPRVTLRKSASADWVAIAIHSPADVAFVLELLGSG